MKRLTGWNYPVFVDNMESVDDLANVQPTGQIFMASYNSSRDEWYYGVILHAFVSRRTGQCQLR